MILSNFSTEVSIFPVADGNVLYLKKYCYQHLPWRTDDYSLRPRWLSHDVQPWLLRWNFAPVLVWNFCGDCLTKYKHDFCCETLHQFWCETFAVIVWRHTTMTFAVKLCTSSAGCETFAVIVWRHTTMTSLWNFAPVLVWNFCGDCLTTYTTMTFAAILCTSAGVKLLRWLSDDIRLWLLLWNFAPVLVWNFCGDCLTTYKHDFCWVDLEREWFQFHLMETANLMLSLCSSYFA